MSINGSVASFLPFTINGLTDASFSNSNLGVATATSLTLTSATPLKLARFDLDKNLVSASVDESEVAVLTSNVFDGTQTMKPGHTTNINNVIETKIIANPPYDKSSFTTSGISGYTAPLGTLTGPTAGEYSISQSVSDRSIMKLSGFLPEVGRKYVYTFTMRIIDTPEAYVSVEQGGVQRSNTILQVGSDNETISDTFTFDPAGSTLVFKIYTGSLDPWTATWSSFSLGYYEASINAPINNLTVNNLATELLTFPSTSTNSESWSVYSISTMGNPSTLGGLVFQEATLGVGAYLTGGVIGATSFQFNTLSGNAGKVVVTNADQVMSTSINAGQLEYITGLTSQAADSITTGSNKITQEYNATVGDISTLVNRATLDAGLALVPNLLPLSNTWTGAYNQFNGTVSTMGSNRFIQPYNAVSADISTLVNRATLDGAIAGLGAGILTLNNSWSGTNTFNNTLTTGTEYTTNLNGTLRTLQTATQFNPTLDANSYFITGVFPTTYVFTTNWTVNPVSGTTANIALDPAVFYFSTSVKYVISFTGIYGTGASWVGTVFNNSTSTTVSDASIAITTSPQNLTMTFTAGSSNPTIYLRFVGASGTLRWTNFTIKEVDLEIMGNLTLSSQIDSNIVQSNGRTANVANGLKVNQTSLATAPTLTTASLPAGVSASSLSGSYTLTATGGGTTFGMWLGSGFTYTAGAKYTFTFTGFSTNATATQAMILYTNTYTGGVGTFIGDYIVNVPITSSTVSGFFTATSNNNVVFNFVSSAAGRSISFTGFTLTRADTEIGGVITATGISSGTPTTTIGLNASNQLIKFAGAVDILPLNNVFTGTNTFNNSLQVAGGNMTCSLGTIAKQTATAGSLVQITGGGALFSPYLEFLFGGSALGFIGQADSTSLDIASQNTASLRFLTDGTQRLLIDTSGTITAQNDVIVNGNFRKVGGSGGTNYFGIRGLDANNSPYIEFFTANVRRSYIGFATATSMSVFTENGAVLQLGTEGATRMTIQTNGRATHSAGDNSYMTYGPNATWSANLVVGATPDKSGAATAQVITTNGNLHMDAGNSNAMYYGYYANQRGTPNSHQFFGSEIYFASGLPQQDTTAIAPICFNGSRLFRSANIHNIIYSNNGVGWSGGINTTYAFYRTNGYVATMIHGKCSYYVGGSTMAYPNLRVYSQNTGQFWYYDLRNFTNNGSNHTTFPFQMIFNSGNTTAVGWFDVYFYSGGNLFTDTNDQLWILADTGMSSQFV